MEVVIVVAIGIALWGAITIAWVLSSQGAPTKSAPPDDSAAEASAAEASAAADQPDEADWAAEAANVGAEMTGASFDTEPPPAAAPLRTESAGALYASSHREVVMPVNALQLNAIEIISGQVERLQAEYVRLDTERERLAQELLTSYLIEKIEGSAGRLKAETRREAQELRQQLVKVSADFERAQFRLASLEHLQARLDDPRVARQIDDLVRMVRHLAGER